MVRVRPEKLHAFKLWIAHSPNVSDLRAAMTPGMRQCATFAGCGVVELGDRASGAGTSQGLKLRFDFNPQKVPASAIEELAAFVYVDSLRYTRVDVAIDYALALGDCTADHDTLRKYATYGAGADLSGWTFGSRKGNRFTRIYDKRREREDKGFADDSLLDELDGAPLWRVEVESRPHGGEPLPAALFAGIRLRAFSAEPLNWRQLAIVRACREDAGFLMRIPSAAGTRAAYKRLLDDCNSELDPSPSSVYDGARSRLLLDLARVELLLLGAEVSNHAAVDTQVPA